MTKEDNLKGTGKRFSSTYQPAKHGRKKDVFKLYKDKYNLSTNDVSSIIEYLLSMPVENLKDIINNANEPALVVNFATAILKGIQKGDLSSVETMLNRKIGRPQDNVKISGEPSDFVINIIGVEPGKTEYP